jgi:ABC-type oligopeptide transport system ATPase subunit
MRRGRIVEHGPADGICEQPDHPYTRLLIASVLDPDPVRQHTLREHRRLLRTHTPDRRASESQTVRVVYRSAG